jgi:hypothetical protein
MVTTQHSALERTIRTNLEQLRQQLDLVQSGLVVATQALKRQNAEQDRDIANILEFDVGGRLDRQIARTNALITSLEPRPGPLPGESDTDEYLRMA